MTRTPSITAHMDLPPHLVHRVTNLIAMFQAILSDSSQQATLSAYLDGVVGRDREALIRCACMGVSPASFASEKGLTQAEVEQIITRGLQKLTKGETATRSAGTRTRPFQSPITLLSRRKGRSGLPFITPEEVDTAHMIHRLFETDPIRYAQIMDQVDPDLQPILEEVACRNVGLEEFERAHDLSARSGKIVLRIALRNLRRCFGAMDEADRMDMEMIG